ncbi:hypothetical protein SUGI_0307860 [Cryptomeria japonica]|nr:hypothetical protein SUGI_0307860 [Cryptomeria japonica]
MPEVLIADQMSYIDDITLSAIDFGLQGYTGTPSTSRRRPKKKNSSKMPKRGKKGEGNSDSFSIDTDESRVLH